MEIWLENGVNDKAFLLAMLTPEQRDELERRARPEWVRFETGGGITSLRTHLEQRLKLGQARRARTCVFMDSDRGAPGGEPSSHVQSVVGLCVENLQDRWLTLERRAIENYLPLDRVRQEIQAFQKGDARDWLAIRFTEFEALPETTRRFIHVKQYFTREGIAGAFGNRLARDVLARSPAHDEFDADAHAELDPHLCHFLSLV